MNELQGRHVLVTGAAGFIGSNLVQELLRYGAVVHVIIRPGTNLWRIKKLLPGLHLHVVDLTNREGLKKTVQEVSPEIIYHLAAQGVSPAFQEHREILRTNILGTFNLLESTALLDYRLFVHLGGSSEYGTKSGPMRESDCLEPLTFYGAAKAAATLLCQQYARANRRPVVVLRAFSVYGYWESPSRLIPTAIRAALCDRELALTAPGYRRDFVFVEDLVEACLLALRAEKASGEIINVGSGLQWSNEEVVDLVQVVTGRRINVRVGAYPARRSDKAHWVADIRKARDLLGWEPRHTLRAGLEKTVSWYLLHQDVYDGLVKEISGESGTESTDSGARSPSDFVNGGL